MMAVHGCEVTERRRMWAKEHALLMRLYCPSAHEGLASYESKQ